MIPAIHPTLTLPTMTSPPRPSPVRCPAQNPAPAMPKSSSEARSDRMRPTPRQRNRTRVFTRRHPAQPRGLRHRHDVRPGAQCARRRRGTAVRRYRTVLRRGDRSRFAIRVQHHLDDGGAFDEPSDGGPSAVRSIRVPVLQDCDVKPSCRPEFSGDRQIFPLRG